MFEEFKNAFQRPNNGHVQLIIINVAVFVLTAVILVFSTIAQHSEIFDIIFTNLALPGKLSLFIQKPWTLLTHAFVHDLKSVLHILFNMLAFYWFGKLFIEYLGSDKLIAVYVLGIISGATLLLLVHNTVPYYINQNNLIGFGASAAVNAVIVATATLLPDYTFFLLLLGPVRIKWIAAFYVFGSFIGSIGDNAGGNIAHLGGALIGFIYIKQLQAGINWGGWITLTLDWIKGFFQSRPKVKVTYRKEEPKVKKATTSVSKASQEEIDTILDKISDRGYESLSKEEKEKLFNASKK
jgi:membrane associated rhomboid family serine protease